MVASRTAAFFSGSLCDQTSNKVAEVRGGESQKSYSQVIGLVPLPFGTCFLLCNVRLVGFGEDPGGSPITDTLSEDTGWRLHH